jgi:hypothetical protein
VNKDSVLLTVLPTKAQLPLHLIRHVNTLCQVLIVLSQKQAKFKQKFTCKKKIHGKEPYFGRINTDPIPYQIATKK